MKSIQFIVLALALVGDLLALAGSASAQTWTPTSAPNTNFVCIASSADGSKLVAGGLRITGPIYTSADGGVTWLLTSAPANSWNSVASSADGNNLVAVQYGGFIFTSTNSGATWISNSAPNASWTSVASSTDGTRLVAVNNSPGTIYVLTNQDTGWSRATNAPNAIWLSVASSADGNRLMAGQSRSSSGFIYISTNGGAAWIRATNAPVLNWVSLASSAAGSALTALGSDVSGLYHCYSSTDFGQTWATNGLPVNDSWISIASSADGRKLVAAGQKSGISTSMNSGATWHTNNAPSMVWQAVAGSADGNKLTAVVPNHGIWTSQTTPTPQLNITTETSDLKLSWLIPSANFVLQQSPDLSGWTDVTNTPVLNLSNLQEEVVLPLTSSNSFYRLESR